MNPALLELLRGAGLEHITIPRKDFIEEHRHLIQLLNKYDIPALRKEASSQKKELDKMIKGGWKGNPKAGFIRRLMAENKKKRLEEGEDTPYGRPVWRLSETNRPDDKITPMKEPWKFKYYKIANPQQNGKNKSQYGASPFLIKHFGNVRAEQEDDEDEDNAPPPPPSEQPLRESAEQKQARKAKYPDSALRPFRGRKKGAPPPAPVPAPSSSSTPMGEVLPEAEPEAEPEADSDKVKAEKEVLEKIRKNKHEFIDPSYFKPLYEVDKEWIALKRKQYPNYPKLDKVLKYDPNQFMKDQREKDKIEFRIIDDFYETPRGVEALLLENEENPEQYTKSEREMIPKLNERFRKAILKAIEKEKGKPNKKGNREIARKAVEEERDKMEEEEVEVEEKQEVEKRPVVKSPTVEEKQERASEPSVEAHSIPTYQELGTLRKRDKQLILRRLRGFSADEILAFYKKEQKRYGGSFRDDYVFRLATLVDAKHRRNGVLSAEAGAKNIVDLANR